MGNLVLSKQEICGSRRSLLLIWCLAANFLERLLSKALSVSRDAGQCAGVRWVLSMKSGLEALCRATFIMFHLNIVIYVSPGQDFHFILCSHGCHFSQCLSNNTRHIFQDSAWTYSLLKSFLTCPGGIWGYFSGLSKCLQQSMMPG